jgi:N-acetylglutamate synthase-like GNAT family acetyltransferase
MYSISIEEDVGTEEIEILRDRIDQHTQSIFRDRISKQLTFFLRDEDRTIVGGVHGKCGSFGWLYVASLWVSEQTRGNGFGTGLMNCIEQEAIKNGCLNAYLDTFSFQAPEFYQKLGYKIFGELEDFPIGHARLFLRKTLIQADYTLKS